MPLSKLLAFLQDAPPASGAAPQNTVGFITGVLAVILLVILIMRRRARKKQG